MANGLRAILISLLGGLVLTAGAGCSGSSGVNTENVLLDILIRDTTKIDFEHTDGVVIRLANNGIFTEELDLLITRRVTNEQGFEEIQADMVLLTCSTEDVVCDHREQECPLRIEALEERRYDSQGQYRGGRDLRGVDNYTFSEDEITCGSFYLYVVSESAINTYSY